MKVLALETASSACSVALWDDGLRATRFVAAGRGHAELLAPMIVEVLAEARLEAGEVDRLAVTVGPGAFTGLRVGLATARGLALATGRPLLGFTTFEVIAQAQAAAGTAGRHLLVVVESRRVELFLQRFDPTLTPLGEPAMLSPEACALWLPQGPLLVAGDGAAALRDALAFRPDTVFAEGSGLPDAALLALLAANPTSGTSLPPRPLYLRAPDVALPGGPTPC